MKVTPYEVERAACLGTDVVYMGVPVEFIIQGYTEVLMVLCRFQVGVVKPIGGTTDTSFICYMQHKTLLRIKLHLPLGGPLF